MQTVLTQVNALVDSRAIKHLIINNSSIISVVKLLSSSKLLDKVATNCCSSSSVVWSLKRMIYIPRSLMLSSADISTLTGPSPVETSY